MAHSKPINREALISELAGHIWQMFIRNGLSSDEAQVVMSTTLNSLFIYNVVEVDPESTLEQQKDRFCQVLSQVVATTAEQMEAEKPKLPEYPH